MENNKRVIHIAPSVYIVLALSILLLPLRWVTAWAIAAMIHEAGHLFVSLLCGAKIRGIYITPGGAIIETDMLTPWKQLLASISGPAAGCCLLLFAKYIPLCATFAFFHSMFNLLPIGDLDGAAILRTVLRMLCNREQASRISHFADIAVRAVLISIGLIAAWKLSWSFAGIVSILFLVRSKKKSLQTKHFIGTICI